MTSQIWWAMMWQLHLPVSSEPHWVDLIWPHGPQVSDLISGYRGWIFLFLLPACVFWSNRGLTAGSKHLQPSQYVQVTYNERQLSVLSLCQEEGDGANQGIAQLCEPTKRSYIGATMTLWIVSYLFYSVHNETILVPLKLQPRGK